MSGYENNNNKYYKKKEKGIIVKSLCIVYLYIEIIIYRQLQVANTKRKKERTNNVSDHLVMCIYTRVYGFSTSVTERKFIIEKKKT